ncbi:pyridoxal phosphate-dependent aminotransferase [Salibacterium qingdaonense]|uniref:Aminotransferase n=1 Tax=Salibacterium qingdaonense TaxID=266892 RepID=A0A1I4P107_9BACI|nr:pyridoxal phosphate-dependent aminotransferase [Salibacterium qingdaonense]SFM21355.1 aminotransferase [Salibacterium qingdaonense]
MQFEPSMKLKRLPDQFFAGLVKQVKQMKDEGIDVINLGQGNPDLPAPAAVVEALQEAAEKPEHHKYSPFRGRKELKQAVADFYSREYGVTLDPESEVAVLFGAKTGLVEISECFLNEGDTALLPDPGYPDYWSGTALAGAETVNMPLREENHFLPDYNELNEETLDKAKLMFLNYPNNPTAATADTAFFEETVNMAARHQICVVHDFAYGAIGYDGFRPPSFLQAEGAKEVGVEMYTLSKTYNMAGWRVAAAVGNPSVIEALNLIQDHLHVSLFGGIQEAAARALTMDQEPVWNLVRTYESRRDVFMAALREQGWEGEDPSGTFFVWLPVPQGYTSNTFADTLLKEEHVAVASGRGFGEQGEGYIRVGLLNHEKHLREAAIRIARYFRSHE